MTGGSRAWSRASDSGSNPRPARSPHPTLSPSRGRGDRATSEPRRVLVLAEHFFHGGGDLAERGVRAHRVQDGLQQVAGASRLIVEAPEGARHGGAVALGPE